jgi:acetyl esterase/lipase
MRERLEQVALAVAGALPTAHPLLARGWAQDNNLEPDLANVLGLSERLGWPAVEHLSVADARREFHREQNVLAWRRPRLGAVAAVTVRGAQGPLDARLYIPRGAPRSGPLLVYLHGGGWVLGCAADSDVLCRWIAREAAVRVLTVSYRLAPEAPFPAALDDARAALRWVRGEALRLGADPGRIAVGGDSAGANLAAGVAREASRSLAAQLLLYPITDVSRERPSYATADGPLLTAAQMRWFRGHYLPRESDAFDVGASPLLAEDLNGLPPAYVAVAGHDPLRDEGLSYADRLRDAGVSVTLGFHERQVHGFGDYAATVPSARAALHDACHWLRAI